jgi:hypothetical protein
MMQADQVGMHCHHAGVQQVVCMGAEVQNKVFTFGPPQKQRM